jgi:hypothetical protein
MSLALAMAAAAQAALPGGVRLTLDCAMFGPGGTRFDLHGASDGVALRTNIADWPGLSISTELEGGLRISVENLVHHYEWNGPPNRVRLNVQMVEYSDQHAAVLTIVQHYSDGRHSVDSLVGTGLCEARRGSPSSGNRQ